MSMRKRKAKIDLHYARSITVDNRQCDLFNVSRSLAYQAPVVVSKKANDLMRKIHYLHPRYPFKGSRRFQHEFVRYGVHLYCLREQIDTDVSSRKRYLPAVENRVLYAH